MYTEATKILDASYRPFSPDPATRRLLATRILSICVAGVWLIHGLSNKLLHGSPRHLQIVQSIPGFSGDTGERVLVIVGVGEVLLAIWVLSGIRPWRAFVVQAAALLSMNMLELTFARDHLLSPVGLLPINFAFLGIAATAAWLREPQKLRPCPLLVKLRRHPVPMAAHFKHCLVLTYAVRADALQRHLPPGLVVDRYGEWGFVAIALVQTDGMRPACLPRCLGASFFLSGYRIFVKHHDGKRTRRGLRILRSDTDRLLMVVAGNALTHYNYRRCDANVIASDGRIEFEVATGDGSADLRIVADLGASDGALPSGSVFRSEQDARRFAGPLPWTFDHEAQTDSIIAIKGVRPAWKPRLVPVNVIRASWFAHGPLRGEEAILSSAFYIRDIDYRWERGIRFSLEGAES